MSVSFSAVSRPPPDLAWRLVQALAIISMVYGLLVARLIAFSEPLLLQMLGHDSLERSEVLYAKGLGAMGIPLFVAAIACLCRKNWGRLMLMICAAILLVGSALWIGVSIFRAYKELVIMSQRTIGPLWLTCVVVDEFINATICPAMILVALRWPELRRCFPGARIPAGFDLIPLARPASRSRVVAVADPLADLPVRLVRWVAIFGLVIAAFGLFTSLCYNLGLNIRGVTFAMAVLGDPRRLVPIVLSATLLVGSWQCAGRKAPGRYVLLAWAPAWTLWLIVIAVRVGPHFLDITSGASRVVFAGAVFFILMRRDIRDSFAAPQAGFEPIVNIQK